MADEVINTSQVGYATGVQKAGGETGLAFDGLRPIDDVVAFGGVLDLKRPFLPSYEMDIRVLIGETVLMLRIS